MIPCAKTYPDHSQAMLLEDEQDDAQIPAMIAVSANPINQRESAIIDQVRPSVS